MYCVTLSFTVERRLRARGGAVHIFRSLLGKETSMSGSSRLVNRPAIVRSICAAALLAAAGVLLLGSAAWAATVTENFNVDPGWDGHNNRVTNPRSITESFGFSNTSNAGGPAGEVGGLITPAGETAYYA